MSTAHLDNAEARDTIALIRATTLRGPTRWTGKPLPDARASKDASNYPERAL